MRTLRYLPVLLAALLAFPAAATTTTDAPGCEAAALVVSDATALTTDAVPTLELGSVELEAALNAGAVVLDAEAALAPDLCFYVTGVLVDGDGNVVGLVGYIAECPGTMV